MHARTHAKEGIDSAFMRNLGMRITEGDPIAG